MTDTIKVPTDWQWVVESDPKVIAALLDRQREALEPIAAAHIGMLPVTVDIQRQWVLAARAALI